MVRVVKLKLNKISFYDIDRIMPNTGNGVRELVFVSKSPIFFQFFYATKISLHFFIIEKEIPLKTLDEKEVEIIRWLLK